MSYRPLCDFWFLARAKLKGGKKRYGAYLGGFPERARVLIGCPLQEPLLHACGGLARLYPYSRGFGEFDRTMDLDPTCEPDILRDCREPEWPHGWSSEFQGTKVFQPWGGILMDPPYSEPDADHYPPGADRYPNPNQLVQNAINCLGIGKKVGLIHYVVPLCPKNAKFVACVGIACGFNNRLRAFTVFERISE